MKKYLLPLIMLSIFETIAITLWLTQNNIFYLFNFSYIGISICKFSCICFRTVPCPCG